MAMSWVNCVSGEYFDSLRESIEEYVSEMLADKKKHKDLIQEIYDAAHSGEPFRCDGKKVLKKNLKLLVRDKCCDILTDLIFEMCEYRDTASNNLHEVYADDQGWFSFEVP